MRCPNCSLNSPSHIIGSFGGGLRDFALSGSSWYEQFRSDCSERGNARYTVINLSRWLSGDSACHSSDWTTIRTRAR